MVDLLRLKSDIAYRFNLYFTKIRTNLGKKIISHEYKNFKDYSSS